MGLGNAVVTPASYARAKQDPAQLLAKAGQPGCKAPEAALIFTCTHSCDIHLHVVAKEPETLQVCWPSLSSHAVAPRVGKGIVWGQHKAKNCSGMSC